MNIQKHTMVDVRKDGEYVFAASWVTDKLVLDSC